MKMNSGVIALLEMSSGNSHSLIGSINLPIVMVTPMSPLDAKPEEPVVTDYALHQNNPNPFNPKTEIRFDLPEAARVELKVFNIMGQEVAKLVDEVKTAGTYRITWDSKTTAGTSAPSGVYVYQIKAGNFVDAKKMMLIK
jgi:hypothetical protein